MAIENHHILFEGKQWNSQRPQSRLRNSKGMIVPLDSKIHRPILHKEVPPVPLIGYHIAKRALKLYTPSPKGVKAIDNMCSSIEKASDHRSVYDVEHELSELAIYAMRLQIPYIRDGQIGKSY